MSYELRLSGQQLDLYERFKKPEGAFLDGEEPERGLSEMDMISARGRSLPDLTIHAAPGNLSFDDAHMHAQEYTGAEPPYGD